MMSYPIISRYIAIIYDKPIINYNIIRRFFFVAHMEKAWMIRRSLNARRCFWRMDHHCWMIGDLTLDFRECFEPQVLMRLNGNMNWFWMFFL